MDLTTARTACALLRDHLTSGRLLATLPEALRPATRAEGYAIQAQLMAFTAQPLFGWKIAATSIAGQKHIGVDGPLAGRLLAESVLADGASIPLAANHMRVAEVEFAFRLGRDLAPRAAAYTRQEVMAAVATLHPAIEIPDSRFDDFTTVGAPQLIADNACASLFILGPGFAEGWRQLDLSAYRVKAEVAGKSTHEGIGSNVLGDPAIAMTWIANELSAHGIAMRAGEVVTTGTCVVPITVSPGDRVTADFGRFGRLSTAFA